MTDDFSPRTLVLGLGNPIRGDDGVGWRVVEMVKDNLPKVKKPSEGTRGEGEGQKPSHRCEFDTLAGGGMNLMELLVGYDRAILVDAIQNDQEPGTVLVFPLEKLENPSAGHLGSTHETNLLTALEVGRKLGAHLPPPGGIMVVAVTANPVFEFSTELSPAVAKGALEAAEKVINLLKVP